jgi:hypothetical protein
MQKYKKTRSVEQGSKGMGEGLVCLLLVAFLRSYPTMWTRIVNDRKTFALDFPS